MCQTPSRQVSDIETNTGDQMKRITIRLPEQQVVVLQRMVDAGEFPNTSEAVRGAVRELIERRADRVLKDNDTF